MSRPTGSEVVKYRGGGSFTVEESRDQWSCHPLVDLLTHTQFLCVHNRWYYLYMILDVRCHVIGKQNTPITYEPCTDYTDYLT